MGLSVKSFLAVATGFSTFKEENGPIDSDGKLDEGEIKLLLKAFPELDEDVIRQAATVRKGNLKHTEDLLESMVKFRRQNGWPTKLEEKDIKAEVADLKPHEFGGKCPEGRPVLVFNCGRVDVDTAPAGEFQKHGQFMLEKLTQEHPECHEHGIALRLNFENASFGILRKMAVADVQRGIDMLRCFPVKVKRVEVVNASRMIRMAIKTVLAVTSKSIRSKVTFES